MATYTNSHILSAVINKWAQPMIQAFAGAKIQSLPFVSMIENKVKSMGFVSPNWSMMSEISPLIEPITGNLVTPYLTKYLSNMDDASIPTMAHGIVDKLIEQGKLELFEGKVIIEEADLKELKDLLTFNLPVDSLDEYVVKTA